MDVNLAHCSILYLLTMSCLHLFQDVMVKWIHLMGTFFFLSPGNNTCFYGKCYYCRESEPACAEGEIMEGSLTLWLPDVWPLQKHRHPWGRTYREGKLARFVLSLNPVSLFISLDFKLGEIQLLDYFNIFIRRKWKCCCADAARHNGGFKGRGW